MKNTRKSQPHLFLIAGGIFAAICIIASTGHPSNKPDASIANTANATVAPDTTSENTDPAPQAPTPEPASSPASSSPTTPPPAVVPAPQPVTPPAPTGCTNGTYTNSSGNAVCSPEAAPTAPAGATAQCADGTYSFSQHRSGTCSHHGGVATWL